MPTVDADLLAAYLYTFPYYEMARTRYLALEFPGNPRRNTVNALRHQRVLIDHRARTVTTPNNDTLYSGAWLDLEAGPIEVTVPLMGTRYWSLHLMDASTRTAAVVGSRHAGAGDLKLWVVIAGDQTAPPPDVQVVTVTTRDAWLLVRIVVEGQDDLAAVHALQDGIQLTALNPGRALRNLPAHPVAPLTPHGSPQDGGNYLAVVNSMLARSGVPEAEQALVDSWAHWGFGAKAPGHLLGPQAERDCGATLTAALPTLNAKIRAGGAMGAGGRQVGGWYYPNPAIGTYGENFALRAAVALGGLGALPPDEAIYLVTSKDSSGQLLHGQFAYRLRVAVSGIPVGAFWSLSMYQVEPDGRMFFTENLAQRYAIGDRTAGLVKNPDGAMDILMQHSEPTGAQQRANWLPAPVGDFRLILRAYHPTSELLQGRVPLPIIDRLAQ